MILRTSGVWQGATWRKALMEAFTQPAGLLEYLGLDRSLLPGAQAAAGTFHLRVPRSYARRIEKGNPDDPLLRQVLPLAAELRPHPGFAWDPVGDLSARSAPGLLQKYQGRALLITSGACAIHCRFCFRRHFPYTDTLARGPGWADTLRFLAGAPDIKEIILSGGDPLFLDDDKLAGLVAELSRIPHLARLRIHTRVPIVLPERVTEDLLAWMTGSRLTPVVVVHCNHANELAGDVVQALEFLHSAGITLLNQSVLLRGVNDCADALCELSRKLFEADVLPYYLHLLDRTQGTAHFEVSERRARDLHRLLRIRLPGYLVPRLVRERAGEPAKTPIQP